MSATPAREVLGDSNKIRWRSITKDEATVNGIFYTCILQPRQLTRIEEDDDGNEQEVWDEKDQDEMRIKASANLQILQKIAKSQITGELCDERITKDSASMRVFLRKGLSIEDQEETLSLTTFDLWQ